MTHVERHTPGTPSWFDLMTPNPEKARTFYSKLFGWDFIIGGDEFGGYTTCVKNGKPVAGLGPMPPNDPSPTVWSVYFETLNMEASYEAVKANGGKTMFEPMVIGEEGRMGMCIDATGAAFGFWEAKKHTGAKIINEPGAMCWCEVNTRDSAKARDFYAAVMGTEAKKMEGADVDYWTLEKSGEAPSYGVMQMDKNWPESVPAHWMPYFLVNQTDSSCELVKVSGGKVCVPPFDTPHGRMAVIEDPFGATFSIISEIK
jgi:uncharacterized protein